MVHVTNSIHLYYDLLYVLNSFKDFHSLYKGTIWSFLITSNNNNNNNLMRCNP